MLRDKFQDLRAVVIGSYNTDLVVWCDAIPAKGESLLGGDFQMFCGGRGANCAVAAARSGCQVKFVGAHGQDMFGNMALERFGREGIDVSDFVELPSSKTGVAMILQERRTAAHAALVASSANNDFSPELVRRAENAIRASDLIFTQFEISSQVLSEIYRLCSRHQRRLVVHASPVQAQMELPKGNYYLLIAEDYEAQLLTGSEDVLGAIRKLHDRGVQNVIIKQKHHSLAFSDGTTIRIQSIPDGPFVQDAGSVECLTAWAGITLASSESLAYAVQIGADALVFSRGRHGAQDSMPYLSELVVERLPSVGRPNT
jgi:ribokinase